jgi:hypothetical protein
MGTPLLASQSRSVWSLLPETTRMLPGLKATPLPPAAPTTLGIHPSSAEAASATGGDTGDENFVAFVEAEDIRSQFLDNPNSRH